MTGFELVAEWVKIAIAEVFRISGILFFARATLAVVQDEAIAKDQWVFNNADFWQGC